MILKQKTTAHEQGKVRFSSNNENGDNNRSSNGRFDHFQFGTNVLVDIPSGRNYYNSLNGHSSNVFLKLFIRDRLCEVPLQECDFSKCENCHAKTYNSGIEKNLCYDPVMCAAVNPAMTKHETFATPGYKARTYANDKDAKKAIDAGNNYA